jgi:hypothetical protein
MTEEIPIPSNVVSASNYRLQVALATARIRGKNTETMCEIYDAIWHRRNIRAIYLASSVDRRRALENYLTEENLARYRFKLVNATKSENVALVSHNLKHL